MAMIKGTAYGHGLTLTSQTLQNSDIKPDAFYSAALPSALLSLATYDKHFTYIPGLLLAI